MLASTQLSLLEKGLAEAKSGAQFSRLNRAKAQTFFLEHRLRVVPPRKSWYFSSRVSHLQFSHRRIQRRKTVGLRGVVDAFVKTCQRWKLGEHDQMVLLGYEPHDVVGQRVLAGDILPSAQDFEDRVGYVVGISLGLEALFGVNAEAEMGWLREPRIELDDNSPLTFMLEGHMANLFTISELVVHERGL